MTEHQLHVLLERAQREQHTKLNLAHKGISRLPASIGNLTHLVELDLTNNSIAVLPKEIGRLTHLSRLELGLNQLESLPDAMVRLTNLASLGLAANRLKVVPEAILGLTNLISLDLPDNQLAELPEELARLKALQHLDLSGNRLDAFPPWLARLKGLVHLDLADNELTELPSEIGKLTNLQYLILGTGARDYPRRGGLNANRLQVLPPEIGSLTNLLVLALGENRLAELPAALGELTRLTELAVPENQLTSLPPEIGKLANLARLDVSRNKLVSLPRELVRLTNLASLDLSHNRLKTLPAEIGELTNLLPSESSPAEGLSLHGNPLVSPPLEVITQGTKAVFAFLRAQHQQGTRRLWQSKMVVVGEGGTGKTSLVAALRGEPFDPQRSSTEGMQAHKALEFPHPRDPHVAMKLFTWDFGGQQIYHATHQFFLTDRALFLLVWNGRLDYAQCRLEYWLETIKARAPASPIVIVATHLDKRTPALPPIKEWKERFNIVAHVAVSNLDPDLQGGIDGLRDTIARVAATLPLMGTEFPAPWVEAVKAIQDRYQQYLTGTDEARNYFEKPILLKELARQGIAGDDAKIMLRWYHDLGGILLFPDDPELHDLVLLNPWWVNRVIAAVLDHADPVLDQGVFTREHMQDVWSDQEDWLRQRLVRLMELFDLSYRIPESDGKSLIVSRLPADPPAYEDTWNAAKNGREIVLRYKLPTIPPGIPSWFLARSHRFSLNLHWRNGALLGHDDKKHVGLLRMFPLERTVELSVRGPFPAGFFALLRDGLEVTLSRYPGLKVQRFVPCPCGNGEPCAQEYDFELLLRRLENGKETIECPQSSADVSIPQLLHGWGGHQGNGLILQKLDERFAELRHDSGQRHGELLAEIRSSRELIQRNFLDLFRSLQEREETHCPNVFLLRPVGQGALGRTLGKKMELTLFCQEPGHWHPTTSSRGMSAANPAGPAAGHYLLSASADWLQPLLPYVRRLARVLRYAAPLGSVPSELALDSQRFLEEVGQMDALTEQLASSATGPNRLASSQANGAMRAEGEALRALRVLLNALDKHQIWGRLRKVFTPEHHYLWLCPKHAARYQ